MFTELIENHAQSRNTTHREGVGFLCSSCWQHKPVSREGGTGYGVDNEGRLHCYECCAKNDREQMKDQSRPFFAYLSGDGKTVSNWPGSPLGKVYNLGFSRSGWHGSKIYRFHVRDVHGRWWQGWGPGEGMYCTLRKIKPPKYAKTWGA